MAKGGRGHAGNVEPDPPSVRRVLEHWRVERCAPSAWPDDPWSAQGFGVLRLADDGLHVVQQRGGVGPFGTSHRQPPRRHRVRRPVCVWRQRCKTVPSRQTVVPRSPGRPGGQNLVRLDRPE